MKSTLLLGFIRTFAPAFGYAESKSQILNNEIMRKVLLILACFIAWNVNPAVAERIRINLGCQKIDNKPIAGGHTKAPIRIPAIYQDGYLLNLPPSHPEYIINIVQDDENVFTSVIPEGVTEYELPNYLCGECEIQFVCGNFCFIGMIIL